jgi:hypothetical protein
VRFWLRQLHNTRFISAIMNRTTLKVNGSDPTNHTMNQTAEINLVVDPELPPNVGALILNGFQGFFAEAQAIRDCALAVRIDSPDDKAGMAAAKRMRLDIRAMRTGAEKRRKEMKADSLRLGKAIDGAYNILEAALVPLEQHLQFQETLAERMELERLNNLRADRAAELADIQWNPPAVDIALMGADEWAAFARDQRDLHELRAARARREEEERLAREAEERRLREEATRKAAEERLRIEAENARLREERAKMEAERRKAEEVARIERERIEAERRKEREAAEAAARAERQAREKAEAEARKLREAEEARIRAEEEAVAKAKAEEEAARRKAERAPDKAKLAKLVEAIAKIEIPQCTSPAGGAIATQAWARLTTVGEWLESQIEAL